MHRKFKVFEPIDLVGFVPNQLADDTEAYLQAPDFDKYSLVVKGKTKCFLLFRSARRGMHAAFMLASDKFSATDGRMVKQFLLDKMQELRSKGVWTISLDTEFLERWHMFVGMKRGMRLQVRGQQARFWMLKNGR